MEICLVEILSSFPIGRGFSLFEPYAWDRFGNGAVRMEVK